MSFLIGHLAMRPRDVWAISLVEYDAAWRGYAERYGLNERGGMTRKRLGELMAEYPDVINPEAV